MKLLCSVVLLWSIACNAVCCDLSDALVKRYGISFSGFEIPISPTEAPAIDIGNGLVQIDLTSNKFAVDGFRHSLLIHPKLKKAWILRSGGISGNFEWFGPISLNKVEVDDCDVQKSSIEIRAIYKSLVFNP